jgi:hypothetical protein
VMCDEVRRQGNGLDDLFEIGRRRIHESGEHTRRAAEVQP